VTQEERRIGEGVAARPARVRTPTYSEGTVRISTLIKVVLGLAALGVFGVLFVRSARNVGAEPYTMNRASLAGWTVALDREHASSGVLLALWPPNTMAAPLFSQLFSRMGVSLNGPNPVAMPLILQSEDDRSLTGAIFPDALVALAKESGLESMQPKPLCMAARRVSAPGVNREVFFVRFDHAAFGEFRRRVAERVGAARGGDTAGFDPASLSPFVIIAATDSGFRSWLPLTGGPTQDCLAPIAVQ